jgi:hypothetical protein
MPAVTLVALVLAGLLLSLSEGAGNSIRATEMRHLHVPAEPAR